MAYPVHEEAMKAQQRSYCFGARKPYIKTEAVFEETKTTAMVLRTRRNLKIWDKRMGRLVDQTGAFVVSKLAKTQKPGTQQPKTKACGGGKQ